MTTDTQASDAPVLYSVVNRVATITLNRPERLNAISHGPNSVHSAIVEHLEAADADDEVHCVVITGAGRAFSSGGDMGKPGQLTSGLDWYWFLTAEDVDNERIRQLRKPVIGAINGLCYGAGLIMAAHFDILIASSEARFGFIETRYGGTGIEGVAYLLGPQWTKFLALSGELITAAKAKEIGLVLEVFEPEIFHDKVADLARRIAAMPLQSNIMNRRLINATMNVTGWRAQDEEVTTARIVKRAR